VEPTNMSDTEWTQKLPKNKPQSNHNYDNDSFTITTTTLHGKKPLKKKAIPTRKIIFCKEESTHHHETIDSPSTDTEQDFPEIKVGCNDYCKADVISVLKFKKNHRECKRQDATHANENENTINIQCENSPTKRQNNPLITTAIDEASEFYELAQAMGSLIMNKQV